MNNYRLVPVAYAVFADNGNIRIWCADPIQAETLRQKYGEELQPLYTAPQPAEQQQPISSDLALDAANHLTNWLDMDLCDCEGAHTCGYTEVKRTRDALRAAAEQHPAPALDARFLEKEEWNDAFAQGFNAGFNSDEKPQPGVAALVEALEEMIGVAERVDSRESFPSDPIERAEDAIRAYRKQGGDL